MSTPIRFALNHMAAPDRSVAGLIAMARALGLDAVEIRNDIDGQAIADGTDPAEIRALAKDAGIAVLSINALQRFNDWSDTRAAEARALAGYAAACGAAALVLCPVNSASWRPDPDARAEGLRAALTGLAPILAEAGVVGLVEALGFEECSLRCKSEAVAAIDALGLGDHVRLVHDTFHHRVAGEEQMFPGHTGLLHLSGVEQRDVPLSELRDPDRVLVGAGDRLGSVAQIRALRAAGYEGPCSFEPFARAFGDSEIRASIDFLRAAAAG